MTKINTEVRKGYTVQPSDNGGFIVYGNGNRSPAEFREIIGSFTTVEDLLLWLARSHLAKLLVIDPAKVEVSEIEKEISRPVPVMGVVKH